MSTLEIMERVKTTDARIWTPGGADPEALAARMVKDYDPNLELGRHTLTGDWCIWLMRRGTDPYPVIGLGQTLPEPDALIERIKAADTRIHGDAALQRMNADNEAWERERRAEADEAAGVAAEAYEWAARDIKGYSGRTANVKGHKRDFKKKG